MIHTPNLIIGAGPRGLAIAGRLRKMGLDFEVLEQKNTVAPSWRNHYDRLHLHTVKDFSALPHPPFPKQYPQYIPKADLLRYYDEYAATFEIKPHFGETVTQVRHTADGWITHSSSGKVFQSEHVIICTGFNRVPNIPEPPGKAAFEGSMIHSTAYKNAEPYAGKSVLVVGMGNSGAEIALDLAEQGIPTTLSVRGPVNIVPREFMGRPTQRTAMLLGKLPHAIGDWIGVQVRRLTFGNLSPYGLQIPDIAPAKQLRLYAKTPVIDIGTIAMIKKGKIKVVGGIEQMDARQITFAGGEQLAIDAVIFATGFRSQVADFLDNPGPVLNHHGHPGKPVPKVKSHPGLFFIGYDAYSNGILHSIYQESGKVAAQIYQD
ncbi:MAG: NAD(P)/FAD-dependent oxidoreductase [Phaeodactylibacter sp.]|nr:NAD(P)/FAD-dependent oxidoreductase [Phaeodactylibacter sp.]